MKSFKNIIKNNTTVTSQYLFLTIKSFIVMKIIVYLIIMSLMVMPYGYNLTIRLTVVIMLNNN